MLIRLSSSTSSFCPASSIGLPIGVSVAGPRLPCVSRLLLLDGHSMAYRAFFALPVDNFSTTHRPADQRGLRVHLDAHQRAARRAADPRRAWPSTSPGRPSGRRSTPSTRPAATRPPTSSGARCRCVQEVLDALRIPYVEAEGYEADDVIATLTTQADRAGHRGADLLRRPRRLPAGQRRRDRALPRQGRLRAGPDGPRGGPGEVRRPARALQRPRRARGRVLRQPARRARRRPQDRRQVDQPVRRPRPASSPTSTRSRARRASRCASTSTACCATAGSTSWSSDVAARGRRRPSWRARSGTASRCTRSSTAWSSGCCATGSSTPSSRSRRRPRRGFEVDGSVLTADGGAGVARRARGARHAGRRQRGRRLGPRHRRRRGRRRRHGGRPARPTSTSPTLDQPAEESLRALARRRRPRPRRCTTPRGRSQALRARGLPLAGVTSDTALAAYLVRPDQRSYDLADLVLRNLQPRAAVRGPSPAARACSTSAADGDAAAPTTPWCGRAPCSTSPPSLDDPARRPPAAPRCSAEIELPLVDVLARMERTGIAVDVAGADRASRPTSPPQMREAQDDAYDAIGGEQINLGSPKQLQVVLFDTARHAQDQAHQDRLHHRRRRARPTSTPRPSTRSSRRCCGTATPPGCGSPSRGC